MTGGRLSTWLLILSLFVTWGLASGAFLDWIFWQVSYDYVYRSHQFMMAGTKFGGFLGSIVAASATAGMAPLLSRKILVRPTLSTAASTIGFALLASVTGAALVKLGFHQAADEWLAPRTRIWFCELLWQGALVGAIVGTGICTVRLIRQRLFRTHRL